MYANAEYLLMCNNFTGKGCLYSANITITSYYMYMKFTVLFIVNYTSARSPNLQV